VTGRARGVGGRRGGPGRSGLGVVLRAFRLEEARPADRIGGSVHARSLVQHPIGRRAQPIGARPLPRQRRPGHPIPYHQRPPKVSLEASRPELSASKESPWSSRPTLSPRTLPS
jgi:hypothetical protein